MADHQLFASTLMSACCMLSPSTGVWMLQGSFWIPVPIVSGHFHGMLSFLLGMMFHFLLSLKLICFSRSLC